MHRFVSMLGLTTAIALSSTLAHAVTADHLQCLKIKKDVIAKATYTADITPSDNTFAAATGCTIKLPAKLLCVDSTQTNTTPTPPGAGTASAAQKYLCYKAKCPVDRPSTSLTDEFGVHAVTVSGTSMVCAPILSPPSCTDGVKNGSETDVDCGGSCSPCANTLDCLVAGDCASGNCSSGTCQGCANDNQCSSGNFCQAGVCTPARSNGAACTTDNQCSSSQCVSNICCATACPASSPATCGFNGTCNASGAACNYYSALTTCPGGTCNGSGACLP
jgi:hypothetical protein